jgi:hypothetical protein
MLNYLKDVLHCLIGLIFVSLCLWILIKIHVYFSKNNKSIENILDNHIQFENKLS